MLKRSKVVAKRDNETGEEKAKHRKHVKEQMVAKRANETAEEKAKRTKDDKESTRANETTLCKIQ